jgi:hypothetical protein
MPNNPFKKQKREQGIGAYTMPEGVSAALLRLESACVRDDVPNLRADVHDGEITVFIDDNNGRTHLVFHRLRNWFERIEVS